MNSAHTLTGSLIKVGTFLVGTWWFQLLLEAKNYPKTRGTVFCPGVEPRSLIAQFQSGLIGVFPPLSMNSENIPATIGNRH